MSRSAVFLCFALGLTTSAGAQFAQPIYQPSSGSVVTNYQPNWAVSLIPQPRHNFGVVARGSEHSHVFEFVNPLQSDIVLSGVRVSCQCASPTIVTPVVKPGEKGQILVKFNTLSFLGDRHSRITVSVTSPQFTELYLDIEGRVRRDIVVDPGQISWGTVRPGETAERSVDIRYAGVGTWQITKVDCNDPNVELTLAETKREGIRIDYRLTAKLKPEHPTGQFAGQVILYTTDSQQSTFPIGLNGYVKALIETDPVVDVGQIQQGKPVVRRIVLKSDNAFVVTETQSSGSQIKLKTSNEKKRMHVIEIEVVPDTEGRLENDIFVKTDLQNEPTPIRVIGEVLPSIQTNSGNAKAEDR